MIQLISPGDSYSARGGICLINFAGFPATIVSAVTSPVTALARSDYGIVFEKRMNITATSC